MTTTRGHTLMLYDGVCGFCDFGVQFILARDHADRFRFAALQSQYAKDILAEFGKDTSEMTTFYILDELPNGHREILERGVAGVRVLRRLGGGWGILGLVASIVPNVLINLGYRVFAANRYRLFGKLDACRLPSPAERAKFVLDTEAA